MASKPKKIIVVVVLILVAALLAGLYKQYFHSPIGQLVLDLYFQGIILNEDQYPEDPLYSSTWEIPTEDIHEMEAELALYIKRNKRVMGTRISVESRDYRRYYIGFLSANGEELIRIYFCHKDAITRNDWLQYYYETDGGGDDYWHITYDVYARRFDNFATNEHD